MRDGSRFAVIYPQDRYEDEGATSDVLTIDGRDPRLVSEQATAILMDDRGPEIEGSVHGILSPYQLASDSSHEIFISTIDSGQESESSWIDRQYEIYKSGHGNRWCFVCEHMGEESTLVKSFGMCSKHYDRWRKHGDPLKVLKPWGIYDRDNFECIECGTDDPGSAIVKGMCKPCYQRNYQRQRQAA